VIPSEDFWSRRAHAPRHCLRFSPLGCMAEFTAETGRGLAAAQRSALRFSRGEGPDSGQAWMRLHVIEQERATPPAPDDWPERLTYAGVGDWITLSAGEWGYGAGDLGKRSALVVLSGALAGQTQLVSRYFLDHYLLNFLFAEWAMLHASAVLDPARERLVMMVGAHNAGKSTTALRLLRAGWHFLADGMLLVQRCDGGLLAGGYPIGEVKLRDDVLARFPEYAHAGDTLRERDKTVVDLRAAHPGRVVETLVRPRSAHVCFVERGGGETVLAAMSPAEARRLAAEHTVYWDEPDRLAHNTATLDYVLRTARLHRLTLGADPDEWIESLETLV
jgi:hypothetical protein